MLILFIHINSIFQVKINTNVMYKNVSKDLFFKL